MKNFLTLLALLLLISSCGGKRRRHGRHTDTTVPTIRTQCNMQAYRNRCTMYQNNNRRFRTHEFVDRYCAQEYRRCFETRRGRHH